MLVIPIITHKIFKTNTIELIKVSLYIEKAKL